MRSWKERLVERGAWIVEKAFEPQATRHKLLASSLQRGRLL